MVIEHALLSVINGQSADFERAMAEAKPLIAASRGFRSVSVRPAVEIPDLYLLIVEWDDVASHRDGFRKSSEYQIWRDLLHKFYHPMPEIQYFGDLI